MVTKQIGHRASRTEARIHRLAVSLAENWGRGTGSSSTAAAELSYKDGNFDIRYSAIEQMQTLSIKYRRKPVFDAVTDNSSMLSSGPIVERYVPGEWELILTGLWRRSARERAKLR
jgi:hypothetical protein